MLLACPKCNTVFRVQTSEIGTGRKVNCGVCKHIWIASPESLIIEQKSINKTESFEKEKSFLKNNLGSQKQINTPLQKQKNDRTELNITKPLISKEINRENEFEQKKKEIKIKKKNFRNVILWFIFGILISIGITGFVFTYHRNYVVAYFPEFIEIYQLLNIEINPNIKNLEITNFSAEVDGDILIIKGKIFNNSILNQLSPKIKISVYNDNNEAISIFEVFGENKIIYPQNFNYFRSEILDYDNISKQNINEFRANMTNEKLILNNW